MVQSGRILPGMNPLFPLMLEGSRVRLEPLSLAHVDGLLAAASESRATYSLTQVPPGVEGMTGWVERALADAERGQVVPFATVDRGRVVGSTRFANLERWDWPGAPVEPLPVGPDALEIGWTWLAASAQRTHV